VFPTLINIFGVVGKVVAQSCLALIFELKFSVEHDRVVTTLNLIKHEISYLCSVLVLVLSKFVRI
jgi:hypothetical protein